MSKAVLIFYAKCFGIGLAMGAISAFLCYSCHAAMTAKEAIAMSVKYDVFNKGVCFKKYVKEIDTEIVSAAKEGQMYAAIPINWPCRGSAVIQKLGLKYTKLGYQVVTDLNTSYLSVTW